jgi:hypothetical protein
MAHASVARWPRAAVLGLLAALVIAVTGMMRMRGESKLRIVPAAPSKKQPGSFDTCDGVYLSEPTFVLPRVMILGGLKTGSTYLHSVLSEHPQLLGSATKEYYFFAENIVNTGSLKNLNDIFPAVSAAERAGRIPFFSPAGELRSVKSAPRVAKLFPCMKFIIIAREPIKRAWSHFQMNVREGQVHKSLTPLFEQMLWQEVAVLEREAGGSDPNLEGLAKCLAQTDEQGLLQNSCSRVDFVSSPVIEMMLTRPVSSLLLDGLYSEPILHWMRYFPRENFHFVKTEALFARPREELKKLHEFLGVSDFQYAEETLQRPVLPWAGTDGHVAPGDYGLPNYEHYDDLLRAVRPWNERMELISGISWEAE